MATRLKKETMKFKTVMGWSSALCLSVCALQAQETNEIEALRKQLKQATDDFEKVMREQRRAIDGLNQKIQALEQAQTNTTGTLPAPRDNRSEPGTAALPADGTPRSLSDPLRVR